jgi:double-stranded uracil-DNA glycosylase
VKDLLTPGLRAVFVGTRGRNGSPHGRHYYDGAGNQFWNLLHLSGLTPVRIDPSDDATLVSYGFGLTDLVWRGDGAESPAPDLAGLHRALRRNRPEAVAFVSRTAAVSYAREVGERLPRGYGPLSWQVVGIPAFVLPGPSGANNAMSVPLRAALWRDLGDFLESL